MADDVRPGQNVDGGTEGMREDTRHREAVTGREVPASSAGSAGPTGLAGAAGAAGPTGQTGRTGQTGSTGLTGSARAAATGERSEVGGRAVGREAREDAAAGGVGLEEAGRGPARGHESAHETHLLPHEESDQLSLRLQHVVSGFVDGPRDAVEEADHVLEEVASRFTDAVTQRRRTLRMSWQSTAEGKSASADTEQLRLALRDYRELTERLLRS